MFVKLKYNITQTRQNTKHIKRGRLKIAQRQNTQTNKVKHIHKIQNEYNIITNKQIQSKDIQTKTKVKQTQSKDTQTKTNKQKKNKQTNTSKDIQSQYNNKQTQSKDIQPKTK